MNHICVDIPKVELYSVTTTQGKTVVRKPDFFDSKMPMSQENMEENIGYSKEITQKDPFFYVSIMYLLSQISNQYIPYINR